ncbi:hypothetical protein GpartN1_g1517.t1 [Galdieria partita]|uniref:non-specific serine/threonine protein kinase n=1 Tax=Galdieria partita TaxID=83374 RepID=A0A9C7PSN9_9RHOD|nr:hypothetical protein GpartN1_g1517.t1 [Galdieria partita]
MDRIACKNDPTDIVANSYPKTDSLWKLFKNQKFFKKEEVTCSQPLGHLYETVFFEELESLIFRSSSEYLNVKLLYFIAEILRQLACSLKPDTKLFSLKETAQAFFLGTFASFETIVSSISSTENGLWDIAGFAKSVATILSIDHTFNWSSELKEQCRLILQQSLKLSLDFSESTEDTEIWFRAKLTSTSKKRRISLTKPFICFQEKAVDQGMSNLFQLEGLGFSKMFECPLFVRYFKYLMFLYFFSQSSRLVYQEFNFPIHLPWKQSFSSFSESFDVATEQSVILCFRCHTVSYCSNEDHQRIVEQLDLSLLKKMKNEEALRCFRLSAPSKLVSLKLLMNSMRVILEDIQRQIRPCLNFNFVVDTLHFLKLIGAKFLSSHGHYFLEPFYELWVLIGVVIYKFQKEEYIEIFLESFQFLWGRLNEGAFHYHCLCLHSIIEYTCQFEKCVSDFILIAAINSISKTTVSENRFFTFLYLVSKCSIPCLARCCSAICSRANGMERRMPKNFLQKISMINDYYCLRDLFHQHSWSILHSWSVHEDKKSLEFPFDLFEWSLDIFQQSFPAEYCLLKEMEKATLQMSFQIPSDTSQQELFVTLLDSNLFQSSTLYKNSVGIHLSRKFEVLLEHILKDDFDGLLALLMNWIQLQNGLVENLFSGFTVLDLRLFLSSARVDVKVPLQLIRLLESFCQESKATIPFSCVLLFLFALLHLKEEHLIANELVEITEKISKRLRDQVFGLKVEDFLLHEILSCLFVRLNFLSLKCVVFCNTVCRLLVDLPIDVMLHLEPPTVFTAFATWEKQLEFFVALCTRRAPLAPFVVVARLQLLQEILSRNRERIAETRNSKQPALQDLKTKCSAYLISILKDWLPFLSYDELVPFDRADIYDIAERCLLYLFEPVMYPVGIVCFESSYVFQVPSLLSLKSWPQVIETIVRISFSKFLSFDELSWTAAYCALVRLFNDRKTHNYLAPISSLGFLFSQEIFNALQTRQLTTVDMSVNSDDFERLLKSNPRQDESIWLRQIACCLLQNSCLESSILIYLRELCLVSLEISVFMFPLILMEIYLSGNVHEWHRVRDGLVATLNNKAFSPRLTVVLIESLDFVRFQCMNLNGLYVHRLNKGQYVNNISIFDSSHLQVVADAAFRVEKYATAIFYNELVLDSRGIVSHSLETADEANLFMRDKENLQNLVECALGLSDFDLIDTVPMITSTLDLFDGQHVYRLATLAERKCQYELTLSYLDQFLVATEKSSHQCCEPQLKKSAFYKLQFILAKCGLHYLSDCIRRNEFYTPESFPEGDRSSKKVSSNDDVNAFSNAVKDLNDWTIFSSETLYPQHFASDGTLSDQRFECIKPEAFRVWHLLESVCYESSSHLSQMVTRLRLISYRDKAEQDFFSELERICLYEDCVHIELDDKTIRELCTINLEQKQFTKFVVWFVKYLNVWTRGQNEITEKEAAFYDISQIAQKLWKPSCVNLQESIDYSTNLLSNVFCLERAKLLYEKREFDSAIKGVSKMLSGFPLQKLMNFSFLECNQTTAPAKLLLETYIHASFVLGRWLYETHSEQAKTVFEKYFNHAKDVCMKSQLLVEVRCQSCYHLASFSDQVLSSIEGYENSTERRFESCLDKQREEELEKCKELSKQNTLTRSQKDELLRHIRSLQREIDYNKARLQATRENCDFWLKNALENYAQCLLFGNHYNVISTFRFVDLWMNNSLSGEVNSYLMSLLQCENSPLILRKFKPLIYQLSSRLDLKDSLFHKAIYQFIFEMAKMYPQDCIWPLLALSKGDRVPQTQKGAERFNVEVSKMDAATKILKQLYPFHSKLIKQMKEVSEAYLELSELPVDSQGEFSTKSLMLSNIRDFVFVRVPNISNNFRHNVDDDQYEEKPTVVSFSEKYQVAGGINHPKVITCLGSDGKEYRQLVKGCDDLRQDAIMQQLFQISNQLLFMSPTTRSRRLFMRTYNVLPLSPCAGVVEWVEGTVPLGIYLIGATGSESESAHCRFRPQDWLSVQCRKKLREAPEHLKSEVFKEICQNFQPVFRYFFLEYFQIPSQCLERRLAYARSVAASSIIGYLIGLGDRHCSNILLDVYTAEIVHIDFGISFEQGRMLRTPERVPFRLTRDIVDGMGCYGVEGPFRRSCEATLSVLQEYKKILLTVIKVFLYDPLFRWALSPLKAFLKQSKKSSNATFLPKQGTFNSLDINLQEANTIQGNSEAARALLRVQEKLNGYLESEQVDTRTHVRRLINDAKNSESLCKMFEGWAPWV